MVALAQLLGWSCGFREWSQCLAQLPAHQHQPHQMGPSPAPRWDLVWHLQFPFKLETPAVTHSSQQEPRGQIPALKTWVGCWQRGTKPSSSSPAFAPAGVQGSLPATLMPSKLPFLPSFFPLQGRAPTVGRAGCTHTLGEATHPSSEDHTASQSCRWRQRHQNQPSAACELIPDASPGDLHCQHHFTSHKMGTTGRVNCLLI